MRGTDKKNSELMNKIPCCLRFPSELHKRAMGEVDRSIDGKTDCGMIGIKAG